MPTYLGTLSAYSIPGSFFSAPEVLDSSFVCHAYFDHVPTARPGPSIYSPLAMRVPTAATHDIRSAI